MVTLPGLNKGDGDMKKELLLFLTVISLLATVNYTYPDPVGETAVVQAGVILKAGEIDSSTVGAGAFAVVIYGKGELHPVTGDWEQLVTVRGYVQGVDAEALRLAHKQEGWSEEIALERIQTLVLVGSPSQKVLDRNRMRPNGQITGQAEPSPLELAIRDSNQVKKKVAAQERVGNADTIDSSQEYYFKALADSGRVAGGFRERRLGLSGKTAKGKEVGRGRRIVQKLAAGALGGIIPSYGLGVILAGTGAAEGVGAVLFLDGIVFFGYPVGAAIGVSLVDPFDRVIFSLAGSLVGCVVNVYIPRTKTYQFRAYEWDAVWNWFVGPLVGATIASELMRKPPESRGLSVGLVPSPRGHLSAVAKLRF